ncbi:hypothetical protein [Leisingera sp. JC1]|uniref:hypothetical protein n=1 Tax=Leisingera sp. JC1 TaxID=1855282 RepID=UPI0008029BEF|nr:hypothetical protein [Leisingera sp. JC1]OBY25367.1 hypothetical protein A9D60_06200 [Leisingera sp. JC1]
MPTDKISIAFTLDEALVLFEAAAKLNEAELLAAKLDECEQQSLFDLEAQLEKSLPAVLSKNYADELVAAKLRLGSK